MTQSVLATMSANIDILHLYNVNIVRRAHITEEVDRHLASPTSDHMFHVSCFFFLNQRGSFEWLSDSDESLSQWGKEAFMSGRVVRTQTFI